MPSAGMEKVKLNHEKMTKLKQKVPRARAQHTAHL